MAVNGTSNSTSSPTAYSYLQYKNKISGLVSGMDVDSIMEKLMKAESAQMEKLQQQKQKYEWTRDAYREVNTSLDAFQKGLFDDYGLKSDWNNKTVTSNSGAITANALSSASGTINISEAKMATAGQKVGTMLNGATADSTIASLGLSDGTFNIKAINEQGEYIEKTVDYKATDKISDVMSKINNSGAGVTAIVSGSSLSLTANVAGTGVDGAINITEDANGLFQKLGFLSGQTGDITTGAGATAGENGYIVANGVKIEGTSNNYTVSGYQISVNNNITTSDSPAKISSTTDIDKTVDKVKAFVETYNGLIKDLNTRVTQKKNVGYEPLTDAQKSEMTTAEIDKWEAAAKQGLLKSDSTINGVLSKMRQTLYSYGTGGNKGAQGDTLSSIGITTSKEWEDNGKLEIDEDKLRAALEKDSDVVSRIFTGDGTKDNPGIVSQLRDTAKAAVTTIEKQAGKDTSASETSYSLGKTIADYTTKIDDWKDRLKDIEERYWNQFSAMEQAIQKANSQSSIFMSGQ